jgi:hypothetical protein
LLAQLDVRDELRDSNVPGLHIFGSADALVPASVAENISHIAPQHWTVLLDSAAHLPFVSHAELCWQHLDRLLSSAGLLQRAPFAQRSKRAVAQSFGNAAASYDLLRNKRNYPRQKPCSISGAAPARSVRSLLKVMQ